MSTSLTQSTVNGKCLMKKEIEKALGDIPAEQATSQQKEAYRLCVEVRDKLEGEEK